MNTLPCNACGIQYPYDQLATLIHGNQVSYLCESCIPKIKELLNAQVQEEKHN